MSDEAIDNNYLILMFSEPFPSRESWLGKIYWSKIIISIFYSNHNAKTIEKQWASQKGANELRHSLLPIAKV